MCNERIQQAKRISLLKARCVYYFYYASLWREQVHLYTPHCDYSLMRVAPFLRASSFMGMRCQ